MFFTYSFFIFYFIGGISYGITYESLQDLWKLQNYDNRIVELKKSFKAMPLRKKLLKLKDEIIKQRDELKFKQDELEETRKKLRQMERTCRDLTFMQRDIETKLYSGEVTSVKELEQLEKKLNKIKNNKGISENLTLELIEEVEELEKQVNEQGNSLKEDKRKYKKYKLKYDTEVYKIKEELFKTEFAREELLENLEKDALNIYEDLKKRKNGIAIALVEDGKCSGCFMNLPIALENSVKSKQKISMCENCGRILYWKGE